MYGKRCSELLQGIGRVTSPRDTGYIEQMDVHRRVWLLSRLANQTSERFFGQEPHYSVSRTWLLFESGYWTLNHLVTNYG